MTMKEMEEVINQDNLDDAKEVDLDSYLHPSYLCAAAVVLEYALEVHVLFASGNTNAIVAARTRRTRKTERIKKTTSKMKKLISK